MTFTCNYRGADLTGAEWRRTRQGRIVCADKRACRRREVSPAVLDILRGRDNGRISANVVAVAVALCIVLALVLWGIIVLLQRI